MGSQSPTLLDYFETDFKPRYKSATSNAKRIRWALRRANKHAGKRITLGDLTPELLSTIAAAEKLASTKAEVAGNIGTAIRRIWRDAHKRGLVDSLPPAKAARVKPWPMTTIPDGEVGLVEYFRTVFLPRALMGRASGTKSQYLVTLRWLAVCLGRLPYLSDLVDDTVMMFLDFRLSRGISPHTVNKDRANLLAIANYAAKKRALAEFLTVKPVNAPLDSPVCWRVEQMQKLLEASRAMPLIIDDVAEAGIFEAFHRVAWDTGERTGAMLAIRWEWLDLDAGWLRVPAAARKGHKPAVYKLRPSTIAALRAIAKPQRDYVFPWRTKDRFYPRYTYLLKAAGLPHGRRWKPQCIRRAFASYLEAAGHNATDALQHTSRTITTRNYLDPTIAVRTQASDVLPELATGKAVAS
jgi:integrase